jgi:hypothetical protein
MKANFKVAIALVAGAAIGGATIQGLHAQATPKAYVVTEIEVIDQAAQDAYIPKVGEGLSQLAAHIWHEAEKLSRSKAKRRSA